MARTGPPFRIINRCLPLPEAWERRFWVERKAWEETRNMPYVMPMERWAREEGRREELQRLIGEILRDRFGSAAEAWTAGVVEIEDAARLRELVGRAWKVPTAEEFGHTLNGHAAPAAED